MMIREGIYFEVRKFIIILDFENNENSKIDKYSENNINLDLNI